MALLSESSEREGGKERANYECYIGGFFGYLSGTATMWLGSLLVALATKVFHSQVAGFIPIAGLLALGLLGLFTVKGGGRAEA